VPVDRLQASKLQQRTRLSTRCFRRPHIVQSNRQPPRPAISAALDKVAAFGVPSGQGAPQAYRRHGAAQIRRGRLEIPAY